MELPKPVPQYVRQRLDDWGRSDPLQSADAAVILSRVICKDLSEVCACDR